MPGSSRDPLDKVGKAPGKVLPLTVSAAERADQEPVAVDDGTLVAETKVDNRPVWVRWIRRSR